MVRTIISKVPLKFIALTFCIGLISLVAEAAQQGRESQLPQPCKSPAPCASKACAMPCAQCCTIKHKNGSSNHQNCIAKCRKAGKA